MTDAEKIEKIKEMVASFWSKFINPRFECKRDYPTLHDIDIILSKPTPATVRDEMEVKPVVVKDETVWVVQYKIRGGDKWLDDSAEAHSLKNARINLQSWIEDVGFPVHRIISRRTVVTEEVVEE